MFFPPSLKYSEPSIVIHFDNVPTNRTTEIIPQMMKIVHKIIADGPEKFDIERIHNAIARGLILNQKESKTVRMCISQVPACWTRCTDRARNTSKHLSEQVRELENICR